MITFLYFSLFFMDIVGPEKQLKMFRVTIYNYTNHNTIEQHSTFLEILSSAK